MSVPSLMQSWLKPASIMLGLFVLAWPKTVLANGAKPCPIIKSDTLSAADQRPRISESPLFPIGDLIPDTQVYCTEQSEKSGVVRRFHERVTLGDGQNIRLDHYEDGIGFAWGEKAKADHPVYNKLSKSYSHQCFICRGLKPAAALAAVVNCEFNPALANGDVMPVKFDVTVRTTGSELGAQINPRAFHGGDYVPPDREKPLKITADDNTTYLDFVGGADGLVYGIFGGTNKLRKDSAEPLLKVLIATSPSVLTYTSSDGEDVSYEFSEADHAHAAASRRYMSQLINLVYQLTERQHQTAAAQTR